MTQDISAHDSTPEDPAPQHHAPQDSMEIDPKALEALVCPLTHGPLRYDRRRKELVSTQARLAYPIRGGVPIMLESEARRVEEPAPGG